MGCGVEVKDKHVKDLNAFDLDLLRWNKIVICTDGDEDGFHIRTLLLAMLYRLTPTLIQKGYVYIAESPLYEITYKEKTWFAYSDKERNEIAASLEGKKFDMQRSKGLGENEPDMMWLTTMSPDTRRLIKVMPEDVERTAETASLEGEIADLRDIISSPARIKKIITDELQNVKKKYAAPRRTEIVYEHQQAAEAQAAAAIEEVPAYPVNVFISREGYFKKITPQSLRMSGEQKYKEGDGPFLQWEGTNADELLVFTDAQQCYKTRLSDFDDAKASVLGDYLPTKLGMDADERFVWACAPGDYSAHLLFFFDNGKAARVELSAYQTQTRRRKLTGAYCDKFPLVSALLLTEDQEMAVGASDGRCVVFHTASLTPKTTRNTQGVGVMAVKARHKLEWARPLSATHIVNAGRYRARSLPAAGALLKEEDRGEQQLEISAGPL